MKMKLTIPLKNKWQTYNTLKCSTMNNYLAFNTSNFYSNNFNFNSVTTLLTFPVFATQNPMKIHINRFSSVKSNSKESPVNESNNPEKIDKRTIIAKVNKNNALYGDPTISQRPVKDPDSGLGQAMLWIAVIFIMLIWLMFFSPQSTPEGLSVENSPFASSETTVTIWKTIRSFFKKI